MAPPICLNFQESVDCVHCNCHSLICGFLWLVLINFIRTSTFTDSSTLKLWYGVLYTKGWVTTINRSINQSISQFIHAIWKDNGVNAISENLAHVCKRNTIHLNCFSSHVIKESHSLIVTPNLINFIVSNRYSESPDVIEKHDM